MRILINLLNYDMQLCYSYQRFTFLCASNRKTAMPYLDILWSSFFFFFSGSSSFFHGYFIGKHNFKIIGQVHDEENN